MTLMAGKGGLSTGSGLPAGRPGCVMRFIGGSLLVGTVYDAESQYQDELIGFGILEGNIPSITATLDDLSSFLLYCARSTHQLNNFN